MYVCMASVKEVIHPSIQAIFPSPNSRKKRLGTGLHEKKKKKQTNKQTNKQTKKNTEVVHATMRAQQRQESFDFKKICFSVIVGRLVCT